MIRDEFQALLRDEFEKILEINSSKGHDYAGDEDALRNFKEIAARTGKTPIEVWSIYFMKHEMSIETYVREGGVASEPIEGRIHDAILYLFLLRGLIEEGCVADPTVEMTIDQEHRAIAVPLSEQREGFGGVA